MNPIKLKADQDVALILNAFFFLTRMNARKFVVYDKNRLKSLGNSSKIMNSTVFLVQFLPNHLKIPQKKV